MDIVSSPTSFEPSEAQQLPFRSRRPPGQDAARDKPTEAEEQPPELKKPPLLKHISSPAFSSPLRHHQRNPSAPHKVKESLNAHSEYITSQDDGVAEHWINQYMIKQEIGRGSFGAVHVAVDQYGHEYAVKEFSKSRLRKRAQSNILRKPLGQRRRGALQGFNSPLHRVGSPEQAANQGNSLDLIKEEIAIMKKLNHPNLVQLIEVLDDPSEDSLYMVMEMCKKGVAMRIGLDQEADPYPEDTCRYWFRDLILGIEYLHAQGVVHRDIKPDNCLITEDDVLKIVDFGVSEMFEKHSEMLTAKSAGSPAFLPPELCVVKHGDVSGKAADIWSMGVTLYCLKFGRIPFQKHQIFDLYESIKFDEPDLSRTDDSDFRDLMSRILDKNPATRIKMSELRQHPWVTKGDTDPLLSEEENTADVIEPPTEAEVDAAITSNMRNLMTVMKAVKKFKGLTLDKSAPVMTSILGDDAEAQFSEPPMQLPSKRHPLPGLEHRSRSTPLENRRPAESSLAVQGVHRVLDPEIGDSLGTRPVAVSDPVAPNNVLRAAAQPPDSDDENDLALNQLHTSLGRPVEPNELPPFRSSMFHAETTDDIGHRGHAHDPLEDKLYLRIGPSTFAGHSTASDESGSFLPDDVYIVSESPGAADVDIYETAYRDEIERILARAQAQEKEPQVYLTRRVDAKLLQLSGLAGKLMAHGEEAKEQFKDYTQFTARRAKVTEVSKALREAAKAEYEKRRQERKAWIDAAKAEKAKQAAQSPETTSVDTAVPAADSTENKPPKMLESTQSWRVKAFDKAFDRGKQAKSSVKGFVDLVKKTSRTKSKDDYT